jgi:hypothetical protein
MVMRIGGRSPQNIIDRVVDGAADRLLNLDGDRPTKLGGPLETQHWLKANYGQWFKLSPKKDGKPVSEPHPWPVAGLAPGAKGTNVYVHNEREVKGATPEKLLAVLQDGGNWAKVCDNLSDAKVEGGGKLEKGARFNWTTFGSNLNGVVTEVSRPRNPDDPVVFAFHGKDSRKGGKEVEVYHRYLMYPIRDQATGQVTGTRLVTEEAQRGMLTRPLPILGATHEKMMGAGHQYVLDCLADAATKRSGWR